MAKKKTSKKKAPRKKLTSERPLKNRPVDEPEPPETETESSEPGDGSDAPTGEEEELVTVETPKKRRGRQPRLPGTEDAEIEELESIAEEYVSIRDQRQQLTTEEVRLKKELLDEMKKNNKTHYLHAGTEITIVVEKERVKVKLKKDDSE